MCTILVQRLGVGPPFLKKLYWIGGSIDFLLLNGMKDVRDAFSLVVCCFFESRVMDILFSVEPGVKGGTKEVNFMDKIKHAEIFFIKILEELIVKNISFLNSIYMK